MVGVAEDGSAILCCTSVGNLTHYRAWEGGIFEVDDAEALNLGAPETLGLLEPGDEVVVLLRHIGINVENHKILLAPPRETSLGSIEGLHLDIAHRTWETLSVGIHGEKECCHSNEQK
jgi:hypothetical protein